MIQELEKVAQHMKKSKDRMMRGLSKEQIRGSFVKYIYTVLSRFVPTMPYPDEWEVVDITPPLVFEESRWTPTCTGEVIFKIKIEDLELYCGYATNWSRDLEYHRPEIFVNGKCPHCGTVWRRVNLESIEDLYSKVTQAMKSPPDWHIEVCPNSWEDEHGGLAAKESCATTGKV
jgi:uncharacterized Zn-finger protein